MTTQITHTGNDAVAMPAPTWAAINIDPDFCVPARRPRTDRQRTFSWRRLFGRDA